jgi:hypothetical protein
MKIGAITNAATVLALGLAAWATPGTVQAQPLYDRINVNLPYTVTIGDKTLQPGDYVIQQLQSAGDSRVVLIYSNNGMKFETSAMSIPALDPNTARDTKLILRQVGNDYYLDKIWVQGKDYGYEFPLPNSVKSREKEMAQSVSVPAQYSTSNTTNTETAANTEQPVQPAAPPPPPQTAQSMNTTPPPVENTPPPAADNTTAQSNPPQSSADRSTDTDNTTDNTSMPHTSAGWLLMLLSGGTLSGAGLSLRRKQ